MTAATQGPTPVGPCVAVHAEPNAATNLRSHTMNHHHTPRHRALTPRAEDNHQEATVNAVTLGVMALAVRAFARHLDRHDADTFPHCHGGCALPTEPAGVSERLTEMVDLLRDAGHELDADVLEGVITDHIVDPVEAPRWFDRGSAVYGLTGDLFMIAADLERMSEEYRTCAQELVAEFQPVTRQASMWWDDDQDVVDRAAEDNYRAHSPSVTGVTEVEIW